MGKDMNDSLKRIYRWQTAYENLFNISRNKKCAQGVPVVAEQVKHPTNIHEDVGFDPWPRSNGLRIWCCHKLWYKAQMQLGFGITVAVAWPGSCCCFDP